MSLGDQAKGREEVTRREAMVARLVEKVVIGRQSRRTCALVQQDLRTSAHPPYLVSYVFSFSNGPERSSREGELDTQRSPFHRLYFETSSEIWCMTQVTTKASSR